MNGWRSRIPKSSNTGQSISVRGGVYGDMNEDTKSDLITVLLNTAEEEAIRANDAWGYGLASGLKQAARIVEAYEAKSKKGISTGE